jgi:predicted acetyltransferase
MENDPNALTGELQRPQIDTTISDKNSLLVDGKMLTSEDDPALLGQALENTERIRSVLYQHMEAMRQANPDYVISLPALQVALLASGAGPGGFKVLDKDRYRVSTSGGVFRDIEDIKPKYHPFWLAVQQSGMLPEVRHLTMQNSSDVWLYAQLPDLNLAEKRFNPERQVYDYEAVAAGINVGTAQLRLIPSKSDVMPEGFESHVYYEVVEKYRAKGYGRQILEELARIAAGHNLTELIATVNADNIASRSVIENNGGQLVGQGKTASGTEVLKFSIPVQR